MNTVASRAMEDHSPARDLNRSRVMHDLLESVARDGAESQRARASEFGIALGLVNAYLNYCVKKGLIRVRKIPTKRYAYYLTPKGFAEKSRLAVHLVSNSLQSFRLARQQYVEGFRALSEQGATRVLLVGLSELTDIATLSAAESGVTLIGILAEKDAAHYVGLPVRADIAAFAGGFDAAVITDLTAPAFSHARVSKFLNPERIVLPAILGVQLTQHEAAE